MQISKYLPVCTEAYNDADNDTQPGTPWIKRGFVPGNQYFNLFAFEDQVVVNFKNDNPVIVGRISHVINYVYENYANRITLDELASREHLSSFYLSHLIHDHMGISFQNFLGFARSEMSEIPLLETNDKISTVAKKVGFSTT